MRYRSLDAWRGLACLLVVVFHSTFYTSAASVLSLNDPASWCISFSERLWLGVSMFFVISGYCITATVESAQRKKLPVTDYFRRRLRRIFPPYLICLAISAVAIGALELLWPGLFSDGNHGIPRPWWLSGWQWFGNLTLTEQWRPHLIGDGRRWLLGHAWTLSYEEQFYAVTGLILLIARQYFFAAAAIVTIGVLLVAPFSPNGFFFDGYWLHFAAGILVYYVVNYRRPWACLPLLAGIAWCVWRPSELLSQAATPQQFSLVAYSFALALIALHPWDAEIADTHLLRPLATCGLWTYSIYLVHWPICKAVSHLLFDADLRNPAATVLATVPLCVAMSVLAGWLFHITVERRFLNS